MSASAVNYLAVGYLDACSCARVLESACLARSRPYAGERHGQECASSGLKCSPAEFVSPSRSLRLWLYSRVNFRSRVSKSRWMVSFRDHFQCFGNLLRGRTLLHRNRAFSLVRSASVSPRANSHHGGLILLESSMLVNRGDIGSDSTIRAVVLLIETGEPVRIRYKVGKPPGGPSRTAPLSHAPCTPRPFHLRL